MLILAYHRVNPEVRDGLSVSPAMLRDQLAWLLERGWVNVVLEETITSGRVEAPRKSFAITFDDGYQDNYLHGAPVLEWLGVRGTVFLVSDMIDSNEPFPWLASDTNSFDSEDLHMTTPQLRDGMERGTFVYGSHTRTHPFLSRLDTDEAWTEIHDSKMQLEKHLGIEVTTFCYPAGDFSEETVDLVREAGYRAAVVTPNRHIPETMLTLHRVGIYSHITPALFRAKTWSVMESAQRLHSFWWARKKLTSGRSDSRSDESP
jgi:peptidoglycan/xylan/chitin deacetylase (PgdA/CDA1 family)